MLYVSKKILTAFQTESYNIYKRYFIIEKQMLQMSFFHITLPLYATQIINPFLNSRISANHDKKERLRVNGEILIFGIVSLL